MNFSYVDYLLQLVFILAIGSVLLAKFYPRLNGLLKYGKTLSSSDSLDKSEDFEPLKLLLNIQVPKFWFYHFYVISFGLSALFFAALHLELELESNNTWIFQFLDGNSHGTIHPTIARLAYFLLLVHSFRRLAETVFILNYNPNSKMNISHYLAGIFFYSAVNINIIINTSIQQENFKAEPDLDYRVFLPLFLYLIGFSDQFLNHFHLSKVIKYNTPTFGMFKHICCAHYFDEILIYTSLSLLLLNTTSFISLLWVVVNLSVSSIETRKYYKINNDGKVPKWSIIPFAI